jgi:hypothetical protein
MLLFTFITMFYSILKRVYFYLTGQGTRQQQQYVEKQQHHEIKHIEFSGSGMFTYYYVGVARALCQHLSEHQRGQIIWCGWSGGSLAALCMAGNVDFEGMTSFVDNVTSSKQTNCSFTSMIQRVYQSIPLLIDTFVDDVVLSRLNNRLCIYTFNLSTMRIDKNQTWTSIKQLSTWIQASCTIPVLMNPWYVQIDNQYMCDPLMFAHLYKRPETYRKHNTIQISPFISIGNILPRFHSYQATHQLGLWKCIGQLSESEKIHLVQYGFSNCVDYLRQYCGLKYTMLNLS